MSTTAETQVGGPAGRAGAGAPDAHGDGAGGPAGTAVLLDAAVTTRCRRRVHLEHDPGAHAPADEDDDPGVALRRADAAAHRAAMTARWADVLGAGAPAVGPPGDAVERGWVAVGTDAGPGERRRRTREAIEGGARYVAGAELPPAGGRRGGAELLVRHDGGWVPVIVVRHRVTDAGSGALTSPVDVPDPDAAVHDDARRLRAVPRDTLRLAHLHRMLGAAGLTPDGAGDPGVPVMGGIVGLDADVVVWVDLAGASSGQGAGGGRSALETYDRRHADRLAVARAARDGRPALAEPTRITECRRCPWWPTCEAELRANDDVSLVVRGDAALRLRGLGVTTVRELAAVDPAAGPGTLAGPDDDAPPALAPAELGEAVALARAWRGDVPLVRRVRRPQVPRADVEIDIDMESLGEDGAYLWGVLLSGADVGLAHGYRGFATWDPVPTLDEGRSFGRFWTWVRDVRARAEVRGLTVRAYCYNEQAENRWLRASVERFAGMPGVPDAAEMESFIASEAWIDLFPAVGTSFLCPHGKGLKRVAPSAGFAWRDPEAGGENSMRWYRSAVGLDGGEPDPTQRTRLLVYNEDDVRATRALREWMSSDAVLAVPHMSEL